MQHKQKRSFQEQISSCTDALHFCFFICRFWHFAATLLSKLTFGSLLKFLCNISSCFNILYFNMHVARFTCVLQHICVAAFKYLFAIFWIYFAFVLQRFPSTSAFTCALCFSSSVLQVIQFFPFVLKHFHSWRAVYSVHVPEFCLHNAFLVTAALVLVLQHLSLCCTFHLHGCIHCACFSNDSMCFPLVLQCLHYSDFYAPASAI